MKVTVTGGTGFLRRPVMGRRSRTWLGGLVVGAATGFLVIEAPFLGGLLFLAFAVPGSVIGPRLAALGGLLAGTGSMTIVVLRLGIASCESFDRGVDQGCTSPDLSPWFVASGAMVTVALGLTVLVVARSR